MNDEHILVTGGLGCIGSWVIRRCTERGLSVSVFDNSSRDRRLRLLLDPEVREEIRLIQGDVAELEDVMGAIEKTGATRILHLAALQVPACRTDPPLGSRVNVTGTANVFETARRRGIPHVAYASSVAVYGHSDRYEKSPLPAEAPLRPETVYGVYKQADEGLAERYWANQGISSIALRPYIVYGPGRDQGLTSSPTRAMLAAAFERSYHIPFGGRAEFQFAEDVADLFLEATLAEAEGASVFNLGANSRSVEEIIEAVEAVRPGMRDRLSFADEPLPFPPAFDETELQNELGPFSYTPLEEGVRRTIELFERAADTELVSPKMLED